MTTRCTLRCLLVAQVLWFVSVGWAGPAVISVGCTVSDLDRAVAFYTGVLEFREVSREEVAGERWERLNGVFGMRARTARLMLGDETFTLTEFLTPRGRAIPEGSRSNDLWFQHIAIVVRDIDAAYSRLRAHGVRQVSTGPQRLPDWNPGAGGIRAFYFQDPDGHNLEIISYPPGKGDSRWQRAEGPLFVGIDHTAIAVADTDRSLRFYRDLLGLQVVGTSENWGPEQERLNLVFGARLRITALRGDAGPGIEFLEYLSPSDGRPVPPDLAVNDLTHWQVVLAGADPTALIAGVRQAGGRPISAGVIETDDAAPGRRAVLVRDSDGHAVSAVDR